MVYVCELNLWGIETHIHHTDIQSHNQCELNLWGIETSILQPIFYTFDKVWIEPVRDWNIVTCLLFNQSSSCELNLWGIETNKGLDLRLMGLKCELNLWGIETKNLVTPENFFLLVWIEPVRDWNNDILSAKNK